MGVSSLPKTVTRQRRGMNADPESSTLTTRLPSHPRYGVVANAGFDATRRDCRIVVSRRVGRCEPGIRTDGEYRRIYEQRAVAFRCFSTSGLIEL